MAINATDDPFASVREAATSAPNYEIDNAAIIDHLTQWQSQCSFVVKAAEGDPIEIEFRTLPKDMDAFVRDLYDFCPDLVDQAPAACTRCSRWRRKWARTSILR